MSVIRIINRKFGRGVAGISSLKGGPDRVKVGYPAGEADSDNIMKALWSEFGTRGGASGGGWGGKVPERPTLRNAMRDNRGKYRDGMKTAARGIIKDAAAGEDPAASKRKALRKLANAAKGDVQESITSLSSPPNSPVTIALKGSSKPLIDSGEMRNAVTFKIEE